MTEPEPAAGAPRALGAALAGALLGALAMVAGGWLLAAGGRALGHADAAAAFRAFLAAGGWVWFPLWGAALGLLRAAWWAEKSAPRWLLLGLALALSLLPLLWRPAVGPDADERRPLTPQAKMRAVLRWSYRSPATVLRIVGMSRDRDPRVREQAVLALGVNLIVTDIERATPLRPPRHDGSPVRDSLRRRLLECLADSVATVRAEAARALWKAPRTFGTQRAAAETLAAVLERTAGGRGVERFAWLALDAAAGAPDSALKRAAARFATATADSELRAAARAAARWPVASRTGVDYKGTR